MYSRSMQQHHHSPTLFLLSFNLIFIYQISMIYGRHDDVRTSLALYYEKAEFVWENITSIGTFFVGPLQSLGNIFCSTYTMSLLNTYVICNYNYNFINKILHTYVYRRKISGFIQMENIMFCLDDFSSVSRKNCSHNKGITT